MLYTVLPYNWLVYPINASSPTKCLSSAAVTPPAQRVQFILGDTDQDGDSGHEPHPLFSEMEELCLDEDGEME